MFVALDTIGDWGCKGPSILMKGDWLRTASAKKSIIKKRLIWSP